MQEIADATFVDLQYGECEPEREAFRTSGLAIRRFDEVDPLRDFDEFAALVAACDLVVSVDNSTVHLAGALGLPVWTLLPFASDWRWTEDGPDSPWYPSMHLYRQPAPGDWTTVFARVRRTTAHLARRRSSDRKRHARNVGSTVNVESGSAPPRVR